MSKYKTFFFLWKIGENRQARSGNRSRGEQSRASAAISPCTYINYSSCTFTIVRNGSQLHYKNSTVGAGDWDELLLISTGRARFRRGFTGKNSGSGSSSDSNSYLDKLQTQRGSHSQIDRDIAVKRATYPHALFPQRTP